MNNAITKYTYTITEMQCNSFNSVELNNNYKDSYIDNKMKKIQCK